MDMNSFLRKAIALLCMAALMGPLAACATKSGATYNPAEAGQPMKVEEGRVLQSRSVVVEGLKGNQVAGWGTVVGATVAGAGAYGLTRADTPLGTAVTIIAAVGGALAGTVAEEQVNRHPGAEYIVKTDDGRNFGVVQVLQGDEKIVPPGSRVLVLHGQQGFVRVVPDTESKPASGTSSQ